MVIKNFEELIKKVQQTGIKKRVAVIAAHDEHTLEAVMEARAKGIIAPVLIGDAGKIFAILQKLKVALNGDITVIPSENDAASAEKGVELIHQGQADFIMKGKIQTADLLKSVVNKDRGLRTESIMSHFVINEIPNYHKLVVLTDGGMVMYPDLEEKKAILANATGFLNSLGYEKPKVAVLAAVETPNPKMPETIDAAALKEMNKKGEISDCVIEGPISYDLAISTEAAKAKGFESPVAGDADILLVPNITAGNILGKSLLFSGKARMAGLILGARVPVVLTSRGATSEEKYLSLVISAAVA